LATALGTCLALTWLNPHVYLDTLALIGSVASQYDNRLAFGLGAITGSFVFFFSLGYGARALAPLFAKLAAWRVLDAGIAALMWSIAGTLILT
jgi:L-lysine exporter family protein LysE/ArgO